MNEVSAAAPACQDIHVFHTQVECCRSPELQSRYLGLLNGPERERRVRFRTPELQLEFLVTRALCRVSLSRWHSTAPGQWCFANNSYGRPLITHPADVAGLQFNLSNSPAMVACAVASDIEIGIDIEPIERVVDTNLAERYFSPSEAKVLRDLNGATRNQRFLELWTLKEAYVKARGLGLSLPLDSFAIETSSAGIVLKCAPQVDPSPEEWRFILSRPDPDHVMALAWRAPVGCSPQVRFFETVPLMGDHREYSQPSQAS